MPDLYPKLEIGSRSLKGNEAEELLKASGLQGLPAVFYDGEGGLNLVVSEGSKYVPNPSAKVAKEVLDFLKNEHAYGNKVMGKGLEARFGGIPYGWDRDILKLVLAVLLRSGSIEVTYQGRRFRNHSDPQCRVPLTNNVAFRNASFAPREAIDLKTLIVAVRQYEQLTGDEVDVEESAISAAFKGLASEEMAQIVPVISDANANQLPVTETLNEYRSTLQVIQDSASDDVVRILAGEGSSFREARERARKIHEAVSSENLKLVRDARTVLRDMWPVLRTRSEDESLQEAAAALEELLDSPEFYESLPQIEELSRELSAAYRTLYLERHARRRTVYEEAVSYLKGLQEWSQLEEGAQGAVLGPLQARACEEAELSASSVTCRRCGATVGQMDSDVAAASELRDEAQERLLLAIAPDTPVERVRVSAFFDGSLESPEAVDAAVERLREHLLKLVAEEVRIVLE